MEKTVNIPNFIESYTVEEANKVDLAVYTFVGLKNDAYIFKVRQKR